MSEVQKTDMPSGLRDTQTWYLNVDPMKVVDPTLIDYIFEHGGHELLDLGCGLGGYAKHLEERGRKLIALDVNEKYVDVARGLGIDARHYDGSTIPLADKSVDTIFMVEVLEHIENPERLIAELRRVARRNLIITVPNCSQSFSAPIVFTHMLDVDHKNFFTADTLRTLLSREFRTIEIIQVVPVDSIIAREFLPRLLFRAWRAFHRRGLIKDRYYFRLIANATL